MRDLVHYSPRDYLDYANLVRINGLKPGTTATIVATVRRSHAFSSPRNPNLSILELHLVDCTGRIKVTRFFAGQRFSSPGWLKSQQRLFPVGATVAVSGLVKETPYGPCFQDPLMEVLESPNAPLQSRQIGRLAAQLAYDTCGAMIDTGKERCCVFVTPGEVSGLAAPGALTCFREPQLAY